MAALPLTTRAYNPADVTLSVGGYLVSGFADDTKILLNKAEDLVNPFEGVDGEISLAISPRTMGTLTISLQNTSGSNGVLELYALQAKTTGIAHFPVIMIDPAGSSVITTFGWIQTQPDYAVSAEIGTRDWVIGIADATTTPNATTGALGAIAGATL